MRNVMAFIVALVISSSALLESRTVHCDETEDAFDVHWRRLEWTWLAAAATVTGGTVALYLSLDAHHQEEKFSDLMSDAEESPVSANLVADQKDKAHDRALAANIMWGVAGGLLISTAVLFFWENHKPEEQPVTVSALPLPDTNGMAVSLSGSF